MEERAWVITEVEEAAWRTEEEEAGGLLSRRGVWPTGGEKKKK